MKRMHEFLNPGLYNWEEKHTGTGEMTQDGTVIYSNDDNGIAANTSTVYQFDHFDKDSDKYIFKLVSNQFTFPSVAVGSLKKNGMKFDVEDESIWVPNITVTLLRPSVTNAGLYAWPKQGTGDYELIDMSAGTRNAMYVYGGLEMPSYYENGFLATLKNIFLKAGCTLTEDGEYAIIPGKYLEMVNDETAKITLLPQEIAIAPIRNPVFRLITTQE